MTDPIREAAEAAERELRARIEERARREARPEDYVYDKAQEAYWDTLDNTLHTDKAVDASIPLELWRVVVQEGDGAGDDAPGTAPRPGRGRPKTRRERTVRPSVDIMRIENDQFVEGSTWWPGEAKIIRDWFIDKDGAYRSPGRRSFNQFRAPPSMVGQASLAQPWISHVAKLWPTESEREFFFDYCAHMVQRPQEKCNAAVVLAGTQGIGKDAALVPVKAAVGVWNSKEVDPDDLFSAYRPWLQTLMLTVNEVRTSKDEFHASSMYNILKPLIAAPPDTLPLNDKYAKLRYVINVLRVFITTNEVHAMFIPEEDRRMFILHSYLPQKWHEKEGDPLYFARFFDWVGSGGAGHVAAWLRERDISRFNAKAPPPRTTGWDAVAGTWEAPDDAVARALERLGKPEVMFGQELLDGQFDDRDEIVSMMKSPRKIGHRMQRDGYLLKKRPDGDRWTFRGEISGKTFRSRLAFVRSEVLEDAPRAVRMIEERGKLLADQEGHPAGANPNVVRAFG
jgi:hypothetical protein